LFSMDHDGRMQLARHFESMYSAAVERQSVRGSGGSAPSLRQKLVGFWLAVKGESVLAAINTFEMMRRLGKSPRDDQVAELSDVLNDIISLNILEAVLANLSFAFWPDNARAGMALLLAPSVAFQSDFTQQLPRKWYELYCAWNANFIWPSHYYDDMMCFTMLLTPTIALGSPETFWYDRTHSLFWVVRSAQLTAMRRALEQQPSDEVRCFHCRQLNPPSDRQPLTSRTARVTRALGERLATASGDDVSEGSGVWWRLATQVVPEQLRRWPRIYQRMPKESPFKLKPL